MDDPRVERTGGQEAGISDGEVAPTRSQRQSRVLGQTLAERSVEHYSGVAETATGEQYEDRKPADSAAQKEKSRPKSTRNGSKSEGRDRKSKGYSHFAFSNDYFKSKCKPSKRDGRLRINISETANSGYVAKALGQSIRNHLDIPHRHKGHNKSGQADEDDAESIAARLQKNVPRPRLNIVIMVIGSRGDIQPFLKVGQILKNKYGHRIRIASHPTFRDFVTTEAGLEFFSVGGDPSELMAFMVKNPGLIPSVQTVRDGEIPRRRAAMAEMFDGFWRACINTTDGETDKNNLAMMGDKFPFIADAIIANPPSMAHYHIAEKLGIPLHVMFTFPYTPTTHFPHPLASINNKKSKVDTDYVNFMSYPLVETMTWQGLGDIVNKFREKSLQLEPVSPLWAPGSLYRMHVPYTYMWSPSLIKKPEDWGPEIDIAGFVFLDLASDFTPPQDLADFLESGEPPIYVGFGSIVVDDPDRFTKMIFEAADRAGVRVLVNKGWGGLGQSNEDTAKNVFMLGNTPHDWLFPRVKAVIHHGGAGTTAIGLKLGKPTMIVPFFGDQPFWGARVAEAKAGAHECISYKNLNADRLSEGIKQCLTEEAQQNAQKLADDIAKEGDGAENAVEHFHRSLPLTGRNNMRCSILTDRVAVWQVKKSSLRLSPLDAELLFQQGKIKWADLTLLRHYDWNDFDGPGGPITGVTGALGTSLYEIGAGFGEVPRNIAKHSKERKDHDQRVAARRKRREERAQRREQPPATDDSFPGEKANGTNDTRPSAPRQKTTTTTASTISTGPSPPLSRQLLDDLGSGAKRTTGALLTLPNDLGLAIAQGLHNAPRLYGDATVRKPMRITGVKSGCVAARKEFQYGVYDAWTGLVNQPKEEWKEADSMAGKFMGLGTGVGKGLGEFVLKGVASVVAPPAFVGQGVIKSVEGWWAGPGTKSFVRRARVVQGEDVVRDLEAMEQEKEGESVLEAARERVADGWGVYEEIWKVVRANDTGPAGKTWIKRERRKWEMNGALEDVDAAREALGALKEGQDVGNVFRRKRREMNGDVEEESMGGSSVGGVEEGSARMPERAVRESASESTVVGTPEEEPTQTGSSADLKHDRVPSIESNRSSAAVV